MSDGYMMYVVDRECIEVIARSVLCACHCTFIYLIIREVCARKMRFTVSLSLLVLCSVDWILYQLDTVTATFEEEEVVCTSVAIPCNSNV